MESKEPPPQTPTPTSTPVRCPRCAAPLSKDLETSSWSLAPFIRDSFSMIGTTVGGSASAFYGFNHGMPPVQRLVKGPMWLQFLIGVPPIMLFSATCAGLAGVNSNMVSERVWSSITLLRKSLFEAFALSFKLQDDLLFKTLWSSTSFSTVGSFNLSCSLGKFPLFNITGYNAHG